MNTCIKWLLVIIFAITPILSSANVHAGELDEVPPYEKKDISIITKISEYIKGTRHLKKARGMEDPHFPASVSIKPHLISIPEDIQVPDIDPAIQNGLLDLEALTPNLLEQLSQKDLKALLDQLSTKKVKVDYHCTGKWHAHPLSAILGDKMNATAALALSMGAQQAPQDLASIIAIAPQAVLPELKGKASSLLCVHVTASALMKMISQINHGNTAIISQSAAELMKIYIKYWAGKDAQRLDDSLHSLVQEINTQQGNLQTITPKQLGVLLGSLLAGSLAHCAKIKSTDEKRQWMVNSVSNLIWAATTYLGMAPWFAANVASAVEASISVGAVAAAAIYNYLRVPRDYESIVRTVEGQIKLSSLESADPASESSRLGILEMIEYMDSVLNLNGQAA